MLFIVLIGIVALGVPLVGVHLHVLVFGPVVPADEDLLQVAEGAVGSGVEAHGEAGDRCVLDVGLVIQRLILVQLFRGAVQVDPIEDVAVDRILPLILRGHALGSVVPDDAVGAGEEAAVNIGQGAEEADVPLQGHILRGVNICILRRRGAGIRAAAAGVGRGGAGLVAAAALAAASGKQAEAEDRDHEDRQNALPIFHGCLHIFIFLLPCSVPTGWTWAGRFCSRKHLEKDKTVHLPQIQCLLWHYIKMFRIIPHFPLLRHTFLKTDYLFPKRYDDFHMTPRGSCAFPPRRLQYMGNLPK